ncbi:MAG: tetratricopeptide repeat protein [Thermoguttaceae bacterium]|nr:tetratricopeptide repeat protein [Thermoguttaceae bacterium]
MAFFPERESITSSRVITLLGTLLAGGVLLLAAAGGCNRGGGDGGEQGAETKGVDTALFSRGAELLEMESWDEAAAAFTEVLKAAPNDENTLFHRASAYLALARENYRAAAEAITNKKEDLAAEKTAAADAAFEKATADCRAIIEKNPDCADAHYALGSIKIYQGEWDNALEEFSAVIRIDPNYAAAYQRRGEVAGFIGDTVSEAADLKKAAELGYQRSEIDEAGNVLSD